MKVKFEKSPSVMTGGKPWFYLLPAKPFGYWSVVWSRPSQCWLVQNCDHQTVGLADKLATAKTIAVKFWQEENTESD